MRELEIISKLKRGDSITPSMMGEEAAPNKLASPSRGLSNKRSNNLTPTKLKLKDNHEEYRALRKREQKER